MPSPGDERTVERWPQVIYVCPDCGRRAEWRHGTKAACACGRTHTGRMPGVPVEVVPVSHLPSDPSPEAIEAAREHLAAHWLGAPSLIREALRAAYSKERELAEREDR